MHLTDWPAAVQGALVADPDLVAAMDRVREVVSTTLGLRKANGLRVRQPLRELAVAVADPEAIEPYAALLAAELNVKHVTLVDLAEVGLAELGVEQRLAVNARAAGPRLGAQVQAVIRAAKAGRWTRRGRRRRGRHRRRAGRARGGRVRAGHGGRRGRAGRPGRRACSPTAAWCCSTPRLDAELEAEGFARDVVRAVQDERKAAGLQVCDRIALTLTRAGRAVAAARGRTWT